MIKQKNGGARPAERGCAWIVTILLTLLLAAAILGSAVLQMMTSAGLHLSVAADDSMLDKQFRSICENIDMMADEYGFSADAVKATISREELRRMVDPPADGRRGYYASTVAQQLDRRCYLC